MANVLSSPWVSEHLSFNKANLSGAVTRTGMLLPPLQTQQGVECAVQSIRNYSAALNRPLAIETGVNYLRPHDFEMSDGSFIRQVAENADCGILLDLHNLWTNERNGREKAVDVIAELPLDRVWEVHIAGGEERNGYWVDGHCGAVPREVRELAYAVIPCLPNVGAITLEVFPAYLPQVVPDEVRREITAMRKICSLPKRGFVGASRQRAAPNGGEPRVEEWEQALAEGILRRSSTSSIGRILRTDPALPLYSELLEEFRSSMLGTALGLTTRLLLFHLGDKGMHDLLSMFWQQFPPEMSAAAEAIRFGQFLSAKQPAVPLLEEILSFEMGALRAMMENSAQRVFIDCDIRLAVTDLLEGRCPARPGPTSFEFIIEPPMTGSDHVAHSDGSYSRRELVDFA